MSFNLLANKQMKQKRDCFKCAHYRICFLRREFDVKKSSGILNINGDGAPGTIIGIYEALAMACIEFMRRKAEEDNAIENV